MAEFLTDDERWQAAVDRDPAADGRFYLAVKTTGIFCRPICSARPQRGNVVFFDSVENALGAGFRACKRCKPLALVIPIADGYEQA